MQSAHPSARRILTKESWSTYCSYLQMQSHLQLWALQSGVLASHRVGGRMNEWWWFWTSRFRSLCLHHFVRFCSLFICVLAWISINSQDTHFSHVLASGENACFESTPCPFASISDDSLRTLSTRLYANMSIRLYESLMRSSAELKMGRTRVKQCKSKTISFQRIEMYYKLDRLNFSDTTNLCMIAFSSSPKFGHTVSAI